MPACAADIKRNRRLNVHYFNALFKSKYKCYAFFKAVVLYVAEYDTSSNFTKVVNAVLQRASLPRAIVVSGIAQITRMAPNNAAFALLGSLVSKRYSLPAESISEIVDYYQSTSDAH